MKPDPRVRRDKTCAVCRRPLGKTVPSTLGVAARARLVEQLALDPFCATSCAKAWHGIDVGGDPSKAAPDDLEWVTA